MEKKIDEIVYRKDLYPRFEPNQQLIQKYADSIDYLPPIKVNQKNILIDGFHRWKAHQLAGKITIKAEVIETKDEKEIKKLAYQTNSNHGLQLDNEEKKIYAQEMIGQMSAKELSIILSVDERTIRNWTESQREALKEERNRKIVELYLRAWNTQQSIADSLGVDRSNISKIIDDVKNGKLSEIHIDFKPLLYNIWNVPKGNETKQFGSLPQVFMENLLYYHTNIMEVVFDPFAGNGTTVDACKKMFRRYYCSDIKVMPGREDDIMQHDITTGLPTNLPKIEMAFLDPPYWKQAKGQYTDLKTDLSNMELDEFNAAMNKLFNELADRKVDKIAVVIQPTQYNNNFKPIEHIFDFHQMLSAKYFIEMRYIIPYSTQQYNAQMIDEAKNLNKCLILNRDLVIWKRK